MKALFIGGTGTISTDVVALAQQRGWEITLLNRGSKKMPEGIHSIIADINDELRNHIVMFKCDGFCHSFFIINIRNDTVNSLRHLFRTTI